MYDINKIRKRPVWENHEIVGYVEMSLKDKDFLNSLDGDFYLGGTEEEQKLDLRQYGSEKELRDEN